MKRRQRLTECLGRRFAYFEVREEGEREGEGKEEGREREMWMG